MPSDEPNARWLRLRAGVPVVRRDGTHLQVGAHPGRRVVLPATDDSAALLARLGAGLDPVGLPPRSAALVASLSVAGLVVAPAERTRRAGLRAATGVHLPGSSPWHDELVARLGAIGVSVGAARDRAGDRTGDEADLVVALTAGEPPREAADRWLLEDRTVLFVAVVDGRVRVGPWVVPGATACLQCLDGHARERDPRHPVVLEQLGETAVAEAEPWLVSLGLAWACADVARWCHAQLPSTWSATVWMDEAVAPTVEHWSRHPWCGCGWSTLDLSR